MPNFTQNSVTQRKAALHGVGPRSGPGSTSFQNTWRTSMGFYVIKGNTGDGSFVTWAELQPTQADNTAGTIANHTATFTGSNSVDSAIQEVRAWNTAHPSNVQGLKLRVMAGGSTPAWALNLDGLGTYQITNTANQPTQTETCPAFWGSAFQAAYYAFQAALVTAYDQAPEIYEVVMSPLVTLYSEPFIRQISVPSDEQALLSHGYLVESSGAQRAVADGVLNGTTTLTSATASFAAGDVGCYIAAPGIPVGTKIASRNSSTSVVLSHAATVSATSVYVVIMGTGTFSDQYQQLMDVQRKVAAWTYTNVGTTINPYQIPVSSGSGPTDESFTDIFIKFCAALSPYISIENNSFRDDYLTGTGQYQTMYAGMGNTGTLNGIQTATTGKIGPGQTVPTLAQFEAVIAACGTLPNAGHVELSAGFDTQISNITPVILGSLGSALPTRTTTTTVPAVPSGLSVASASSTSLTATWKASYNGGVAGSATYTVAYRTTASGPGGAFTTFATGVAGLTSTITGLTTSTSYDVEISAQNSNGSSAFCAFVSATPAASPVAPNAPTWPAVSPAVASGEVDWDWNVPTQPGTAVITSYTLTEQVSTDGGSTWTSLTPVVLSDGPPPTSAYADTTLTNGLLYRASVTATSSAGPSSASSYSASVMPTAGPSGGDVLAGPTVNVDVSAWVTGQITITRGRSRETDQYQAGTLSFTLRNEDDRFDPTWTGSPYYPGIVPRVPVALYLNGEQIFGGYIDDYQPGYIMPKVATMTVTALDGFTLLANTQLSQFAAPQQTTGDRIAAVLQRPEVGYPSSYTLNAGVSVLQPSVQDQVAALDHCQTAAVSEGGLLFCDRTGQLQFKDRTVIPTQYAAWPNGQLTITDTGVSHNGEAIPYVDVSIASASTLLFNQVTGTRSGGVAQIANDASSQSTYLIRALSLPTLENVSDGDVLNLCNFYLGQFSQPEVRFDTLTVEHRGLTAEQQTALAQLDITSVVVAERTRPGGHGLITQLSMVEAVSWALDASADSYKQTFGVQNVTAGAYFILDSATLGILDQTPLFF